MDTTVEIEEIKIKGTTVLRAAPAASPDGSVTWIFKGELEGKELEVRQKGSGTVIAGKSSQSSRVTERPFKKPGTEEGLEYEIFDIAKNTRLEWENRSRGQCIKPTEPPK